jgi:hypothetical protein
MASSPSQKSVPDPPGDSITPSLPPRFCIDTFVSEELKDMAFECTLMDDPVVAADGHTYNREEIEKWFKDHDVSPLTSEPLIDKILRPNIAIRRQIIAWREKHGLSPLVFPAPAKAAVAGGRAKASISKPAVMCGVSKQPSQIFCVNCCKAICINCATDVARCQQHTLQPLANIVTPLLEVHTLWSDLQQGRPEQLQKECQRVDEAAAAAISAFKSIVEREAATLKDELHKTCVGDIECALQQQSQLLADVELSLASPDAAVAGMCAHVPFEHY